MNTVLNTVMNSEDYDMPLLSEILKGITFKKIYKKRFSGRYPYPRYKRLRIK